jgi:methyl-accepting chemotaxis protein
MRLGWTINRKLVLLSAMGLLFLVVVSAVGYWGMSFESSGREILENQALLRHHLEADNAHKAIHADVFEALEVGTQKADARGRASAGEDQTSASEQAGAAPNAPESAAIDSVAQLEQRVLGQFEAHKQAIEKQLQFLSSRRQSDEIRAPLAEAAANLTNYVNSADQFMRIALVDPAAARLSEESFLNTVDEMQASLTKVSDALERISTQAFEKERRAAQNNRSLIVVVSTIALLALLLIAWRVAKSIVGPLQRAVAVAQAVADGDLTQKIEASSSDETAQLMEALRRMNEGLNRKISAASGQIAEIGGALLNASRQLAEGSSHLSARTQQQASTVEETVANTEQLSTTVQHNAQNSAEAKRLAEAASVVAGRSAETVAQVVQTMQTIRSGSAQIAEITALIDSIAFQTNILSLNAAVEAARAGEQGRGFAVVAAEIRSLAQRCADAAKEIRQLIESSTRNVEVGSKFAGEAGNSMTETVDSIRRVTSLMFDIANASQEQSEGIQELRQAIAQIDDMTQQNAALVEQTGAAAESVQRQAGQLYAAMAGFKVQAGAESDGVESRTAPTRFQRGERGRVDGVLVQLNDHPR